MSRKNQIAVTELLKQRSFDSPSQAMEAAASIDALGSLLSKWLNAKMTRRYDAAMQRSFGTFPRQRWRRSLYRCDGKSLVKMVERKDRKEEKDAKMLLRSFGKF